MKKLLSFLFLFASVHSFAQYSPNPGNYGTQLNRLLPIKILHVPEKDSDIVDDTNTSAQIYINKQDSSLRYYYKGLVFTVKGGNTVPIDSINDQLNARVLIANLPSILAPYVPITSFDSLGLANGFLTAPVANAQLAHSSFFFFSSNLLLSGGGTATLGNSFTINADTTKLVTIMALKDSIAHLGAGFWAEIGTQIHNTNSGRVNIFGSYFDSTGNVYSGHDSANIYISNKAIDIYAANYISQHSNTFSWESDYAGDGMMYLSGAAATGIQFGVGGIVDGNGTIFTLDDVMRKIVLHADSGVTINGYRMPLTDGSSGQVATTNGSGQVSWTSAAVKLPLTGIVGGGGADDPVNGSATFTDTKLIGMSARIMIFYAEMPLLDYGNHSKFTFNNSTGTITLTGSITFTTGYSLYINLNQ